MFPTAPAPSAPAPSGPPSNPFAGLAPTSSMSRRPYLAEDGKYGVYWLKIQTLKVQNTRDGGLLAALDGEIVKVVSASDVNSCHREGDEVSSAVKKNAANTYFDEFVSSVCWCLMDAKFKSLFPNAKTVKDIPAGGRHPQTGEYIAGAMEAAAAHAFGATQPFTNTVIEVRVWRHVTGQKSATPGKPIAKVEFKGVVPNEILVAQLSAGARKRFPSSHPVSLPADAVTPAMQAVGVALPTAQAAFGQPVPAAAPAFGAPAFGAPVAPAPAQPAPPAANPFAF